MTPADRTRAFSQGLHASGRTHVVPEGGGLEEALAAVWARVERAHLDRPVEAARFFAYLGARVPEGDLVASLRAFHVEDLYLACACAAGAERAVAALEATIMPGVARRLAGAGVASADRMDVLQQLREQMLVGREGQRGITRYDGRAALGSWLHVCAVRAARRSGQRRARPLDEEALGQVAPGLEDPEIAYLKRRYGRVFKAAFEEALAALERRERTLLRLAVVDGFGIDQLAAIYHVHRATAARRLQAARTRLVGLTRQGMAARLKLTPAEVESILKLIRSQADVTIRSLLPGRGRAPTEN